MRDGPALHRERRWAGIGVLAVALADVAPGSAWAGASPVPDVAAAVLRSPPSPVALPGGPAVSDGERCSSTALENTTGGAERPPARIDLGAVVFDAALQGKLAAVVLYRGGCEGLHDAIRPLARPDGDDDHLAARYTVIALDADDDTPSLIVAGQPMSPGAFAGSLGSVRLPVYLVFDGRGIVLARFDAPRSTDRLVERLATLFTQAVPGPGEADGAGAARAPPARPAGRRHAGTVHPSEPSAPTVVVVRKRNCPACGRLDGAARGGRRARVLLEYFDVLNLSLDSPAPFVAPDGRRTTEGAWLGGLGVESAPSVLVLSADGHVVGTVAAHEPPIVMESMLEFVLTESYRFEPSFAHYLEHRLEHLRQHGIDAGSPAAR